MPYRSRMKPWKLAAARRMRRRPTPGERTIWALVRQHGTGADRVTPLGARVRRQEQMLGYIADFYIPSARLVLEVDGGSHEGRADYDATRDANLLAKGIRTLRVSEELARTQPQAVLDALRLALAETPKGASGIV